MYIALDNKASKNKVGKISQYIHGAETDNNSAETDKKG
jgi:hypothetical protein